jgi:hypothetical protein
MTPLKYETLERLSVPRPVDRLAYAQAFCRGRRVLDIGCLDETALQKRDTSHWLHGRIATVARSVIGIDLSDQIPADGLTTGPDARIFRGNGLDPRAPGLVDDEIEVIVAGEFIEHIEQPIAFIAGLKQRFPGRELLLSTPNGIAIANTLCGMIGSEAQHPDHIHVFTYKILHTVCRRAGLAEFEIIPYRFYATELILGSSGLTRRLAQTSEVVVRAAEWCFPLLSFGYLVRARL